MRDYREINTLPPLTSGSHASIKVGACVMEAVAYVAGEPWSDNPACACPVISTFLRSWNDALPDNERDVLLRPFIPLVIGTRSTLAVEQRRASLAMDWLIRKNTTAWLRLAGLTVQADALASLSEITDFAQYLSLVPALKAARQDARAAQAASQTAAWAAARAAARAATCEAAGEAAWAAARDVAWDAAWAAARDVAWDAAWAAARDVAWDAAWAAAKAAARDVAWDALNPTRSALQQSAVRLVHRMIEVSE